MHELVRYIACQLANELYAKALFVAPWLSVKKLTVATLVKYVLEHLTLTFSEIIIYI